MNTPEVLAAAKESSVYRSRPAPLTDRYDKWVASQGFSQVDVERLSQWKTEHAKLEGGPYISVKTANAMFQIHAGLVSMLQQRVDLPKKGLDAGEYAPEVVLAVIELAYNIIEPQQLIHDILTPAAVPPFPSEALEEKLKVIELALQWKFGPVADLVSVGMELEGVINIFQHAYIVHDARSNGLVRLQCVCDEMEKDPLYARAVCSVMVSVADDMDDPQDRAFTLSMISHIRSKY
ncbi:hypothetical protein AAF712_014598 [Marasmius tenuissimus]|uniref:Uncharacterized protein n=1 Tax=Marasmius tenuissimus TaxID=585030 RepID=A0ABR2ZBT4_9AGAR